jgi:1-acyl-sn-glycerol-3-phosphate acyltransferase
MSKALTHQYPPRTHYYVDWMLPLFAALLGLGTCLFLSLQDERQLQRAPAYFGGWFFGLILIRLYPYRYRVIGFVPPFMGILTIWILIFGNTNNWPVYAVGVASLLGGLGAGALLRYRDKFRNKILHFYALSVLSAAVGIGLVMLFRREFFVAYQWAYLIVAGLLFLISTISVTRALVEIGFDLSFSMMYRVEAKGPGLEKIPLNGPVIVIANHAQWFDPLFIAKFVPREITPMMTAGFYDLPILRFLMRRVFHTIRVDEKAVRREVPEIEEALAALDAGKCLVIFPEGYLRRSEDQVIRRFGRGLWQVLQQRPDVPVISCWIEGSWGSFFSHYNGPPTKNKRLDKFRAIPVAVGDPVTIPKELLEDHLQTRLFFMKQVLAARALLNLPPVPLPELKTTGEIEIDPGRGETA